MSDGPEIWRYRRWVVVVAAAAVVSVFVIALLVLRPDPRGAVLWENYPPGLQQQIEDAAAARDCDTLASLREDAVATEMTQVEETGVGSETLIRYLDDELAAAGCSP